MTARTPEEIAREIAARRLSGDPTQWDLTSIIAAAIRAEREARLKAEAERDVIREKNTALNRRAIKAEAGLLKKLEDAGGRSIGRALANAGYSAERERGDRLSGRVEVLEAVLEDTLRVAEGANMLLTGEIRGPKRLGELDLGILANARAALSGVDEQEKG